MIGDHLAISWGLLQAPLNPLKMDVSRGPPGLSDGPGHAIHLGGFQLPLMLACSFKGTLLKN